MSTSLLKAHGLAGVALAAAVLALAGPARAVALSNGGLLNSWETTDPMDTQGWYTPSWSAYPSPNGNWLTSTDTATNGTHSIQVTYTSAPTPGNFDWALRFESWGLSATDKTNWELPWHEALSDTKGNYSLVWDTIYRVAGPGRAGVPQPATWANMSVAVEWDQPTTSGGSSGWTQFDQLALGHPNADQVVSGRIPFSKLIGARAGTPITNDFWWVQLSMAFNGDWPYNQQVALYVDNLRIVQDGDANGDGVVNADDYALIDRGFAKGLTGHANGDFNFDGVIDANDYLIIDQAYIKQNGALAPGMLAEREAQFGAGYVSSLMASVPEPGSVGMLAAGVVLACRRRRGC